MLCDFCNSKSMKKIRHKKEKQLEAQASSAEQHHECGSGEGAPPVVVVEELAAVDSREGEKCFPSKKSNS